MTFLSGRRDLLGLALGLVGLPGLAIAAVTEARLESAGRGRARLTVSANTATDRTSTMSGTAAGLECRKCWNLWMGVLSCVSKDATCVELPDSTFSNSCEGCEPVVVSLMNLSSLPCADRRGIAG